MNDKYWCVLRVKPRHEFMVDNCLNKFGFTTYCPYITEIRQWSDRKKKIKLPLFPRLIFVKINPANFNSVFVHQSIQGYLFVQNKRAQVRDWELESVRNYCAQVYSEPHKSFAVGQCVDVPILGAKGEVIDVRGNICTVMLLGGHIKTQFRIAS